jgi:hypothetical protein
MQMEKFFEISRSLATNFGDSGTPFHDSDSCLLAALENR